MHKGPIAQLVTQLIGYATDATLIQEKQRESQKSPTTGDGNKTGKRVGNDKASLMQ